MHIDQIPYACKWFQPCPQYIPQEALSFLQLHSKGKTQLDSLHSKVTYYVIKHKVNLCLRGVHLSLLRQYNTCLDTRGTIIFRDKIFLFRTIESDSIRCDLILFHEI